MVRIVASIEQYLLICFIEMDVKDRLERHVFKRHMNNVEISGGFPAKVTE